MALRLELPTDCDNSEEFPPIITGKAEETTTWVRPVRVGPILFSNNLEI